MLESLSRAHACDDMRDAGCAAHSVEGAHVASAPLRMCCVCSRLLCPWCARFVPGTDAGFSRDHFFV